MRSRIDYSNVYRNNREVNRRAQIRVILLLLTVRYNFARCDRLTCKPELIRQALFVDYSVGKNPDCMCVNNCAVWPLVLEN